MVPSPGGTVGQFNYLSHLRFYSTDVLQVCDRLHSYRSDEIRPKSYQFSHRPEKDATKLLLNSEEIGGSNFVFSHCHTPWQPASEIVDSFSSVTCSSRKLH